MANNIVKSFDIFPYAVDKHDNIWKYTEAGYFIKVSPWKSGEDRRVNRFEIENLIKNGKLVQYSTKSNVFEKLNKRWDNTIYQWIHDGILYQVELQNKNGEDFFKAPVHKFIHKYKDASGNYREYFNEYRIVFYNGNIYWANSYHYWPQVILWKFESIDKEPNRNLNSYQRWTKGYHVRPIWNTNKQEYI